MDRRFLSVLLVQVFALLGFGVVFYPSATPLLPATDAMSNAARAQGSVDQVKKNETVDPSLSFQVKTPPASPLESLGITLHPGSEFTSDDQPTSGSLNRCRNLVYQTLVSLPVVVSENIHDLTLYFSEEGRRGLAGGHTMILRCLNVSNKELVAVTVHESGHIVDTGFMKGNFLSGKSEFQDGGVPVYQDDPSLLFYRLSFLDEKHLKPESSVEDFVSGYATSDPFEDFAETFGFYVLHGREFRTMMASNPVLAQKYAFMKTWVFQGKEFENGDETRTLSVTQRDYDTTVLDYDLTKFFTL